MVKLSFFRWYDFLTLRAFEFVEDWDERREKRRMSSLEEVWEAK